jgi:hypothetical protein
LFEVQIDHNVALQPRILVLKNFGSESRHLKQLSCSQRTVHLAIGDA